jgi:Tol biopolymer transport system component
VLRNIRRRAALAVLASAVTSVALLAGGAGNAAASRLLLPMFDGNLGTWSPDSRLVAVPGTKVISLFGTDGSLAGKLRGPGIGYFGFPCECSLGWTEDSSKILYVSQEEELDGEESVIGSVAADGSSGEHRSIAAPIGDAAWAPAGWPLIYILDSRSWYSGTKGKRVGPNPDLWRLDSLYAKPRKLIASRADEESPLFSPDGTEITFTRSNERSTSLWKASADGTGAKRLVNNLLGPSAVAWSPDGRLVALSTYSRKRNDRRCHLYVIPADGGRPRQIVNEEILDNRPAWTPDGRWITFSTYKGEIRKVRPDGTGLQTIASFPGKEVRGLSWSPDGRHLTYSARIPPRSD